MSGAVSPPRQLRRGNKVSEGCVKVGKGKNGEREEELLRRETDLFLPVKKWLEDAGFSVQGEIGKIDVFGIKSTERGTLSVAAELKLRLNLDLVLQAFARSDRADIVYIVFPFKNQDLTALKKLCRHLGIGILLYQETKGELTEILPPMISKRLLANQKKKALIGEFHNRKLRTTQGGTNGKVLSYYRETALSIGFLMQKKGSVSLRELRAYGVKNPEKYVYANYYGWFEKTEKRGHYRLSERGEAELDSYQDYREQLDLQELQVESGGAGEERGEG